MTWLYVPDLTGSLFAADMEASSWELSESFQNQEPFVMWRGNCLQLSTLSKKWKKVNWIKRLSGLMLKPSTANLGVEKWIGSLEVFHVNPIQRLENKWGNKIPEIYGPILSESLGKCDQDSYSLRMFQTSLNFDLIKLSLTSTPSGILLHGALWRLPMLAQGIKEKDGSAWRFFATPTVMDSTNLGMRTIAKESLEKGNWRGIDLKTSAKLIPTPTASDSMRTNNHHQRGNLKLKGYAEMFPTPTTQANAQIAGQYDKRTGTTLAGHVKMFPTPLAREANETGGSMDRHRKLNRENDSLTRSISGEEDLEICGRLNPQWVAWLMGLPIGWINSEY